MEGFYVVFDRENDQIGFAASACAKSQCLDGDSCNEKAPAIIGVLHTGMFYLQSSKVKEAKREIVVDDCR